MNTITLTQLTAGLHDAGLGASRFDIQNWMARLPLTTKFRDFTSKERPFDRDNALEIALLARLIGPGGMTPASAAERVGRLLKKLKGESPYGWVTITDPRFFPADIIVGKEPPGEAFLRKHSFVQVINLAEIKEHIDGLFRTESEPQ